MLLNLLLVHLTGREGGSAAIASVTQAERSIKITTRLLSIATMIVDKGVCTILKAMNVEQRRLAVQTSYSIAH